jgi:hypothetical protein
MAHKKYKNKDGIVVPSVTTIIDKACGYNKAMLLGWTRKNCLAGIDTKTISKEATSTGTLIHKYIECFIKNSMDDIELDQLKSIATLEQITLAERGLEEYKKIMLEYNITPIESEYAGVNEEYQYGFTTDLIAEKDGIVGLVDFKSSKGLYADHIIQGGAYFNAIKEVYNPQWFSIFHIKKDFDTYLNLEFWHVELETLPFYENKTSNQRAMVCQPFFVQFLFGHKVC